MDWINFQCTFWHFNRQSGNHQSSRNTLETLGVIANFLQIIIDKMEHGTYSYHELSRYSTEAGFPKKTVDTGEGEREWIVSLDPALNIMWREYSRLWWERDRPVPTARHSGSCNFVKQQSRLLSAPLQHFSLSESILFSIRHEFMNISN